MPMSVAQIINELPKLTEAERETVKERLKKLEMDEEVRLMGMVACNAMKAIDAMDEEYARLKRKGR